MLSNHGKQSLGYIQKYSLRKSILPPKLEPFDFEMSRCNQQLASKSSDLEKYIYLSQLRNHRTDLFYRLLVNDMDTFAPLVYTPTVGLACQRWSNIYTEPEGLYLPITSKGKIQELINQWPHRDARICVVTDGGRILGLGDLGYGGVGISIGKLSLYTACAGIAPNTTLPIVLDMGTDNEELLNDPLYLGLKQPRVDASVQSEFMEEFMKCITTSFPSIIVQFEDFQSVSAFKWLEEYQDRYACFNDDIQGTGAVILSGVQKAIALTGIPVADHKIVFFGAGSAGVGVAKMISQWIGLESGMTEEEAKSKVWLVDSKGLVSHARGDTLAEHKLYFARNDISVAQAPKVSDLQSVLELVQPTILIGLSTVGGSFTPSIIEYMGSINDKPIIMPLSNPLTKAECTFEEALTYTQGRAIFASGSPFPPHQYQGVEYLAGQGNNMYIFPGLGLGSILGKCSRVTESMIMAASTALANSVTDQETSRGMIYPELTRIRQVSVQVAMAVMEAASLAGVGEIPDTHDLEAWILNQMYDPFKV